MHTSREGIRRLPHVDSRDYKLITANPRDNIAISKRSFEHLRGGYDRQVARLMTVDIIDLFQTIKINKKQQAGLIITASGAH